jgi:hypothetical protein
MRLRHVDVAAERRLPVAEMAVDRVLGGPQVSDRLAAPVHVVELRAHHGAQDAAAPVRGEHADHREPGCPHHAARHGQLERERAAAADDGVALARREHPGRFHERHEPLRVAGRGRGAEVVEYRRDRREDFVG